MKSFHDLTPIGQAQRLRPHATRILETCGVRAVRLRQLTAASNIIFRVDAQGGRRLILRITSPKSAHSIENVRSEVS